MMAGMSVADVPVVTRNDDLLDGNLIRRWLAWGFVWLLVFPTVGAVVAAKFNHPDFLGGVAWLSFGRLRPIHVNGVIWGAFSTLFIGLAHYVVPRLCGVRVAGERVGPWLLWSWNVNHAGRLRHHLLLPARQPPRATVQSQALAHRLLVVGLLLSVRGHPPLSLRADRRVGTDDRHRLVDDADHPGLDGHPELLRHRRPA